MSETIATAPPPTEAYTPAEAQAPMDFSSIVQNLYDPNYEGTHFVINNEDDAAAAEILTQNTLRLLGNTMLNGAAQQPEAQQMRYRTDEARTLKAEASRPTYDRLRAAAFNLGHTAVPGQTQSEMPRTFAQSQKRRRQQQRSFGTMFNEEFRSSPRFSHEDAYASASRSQFGYEAPSQPAKEAPAFVPTFDLNFSDAKFSPEAMDKARQILAETAREKQASPNDILARSDVARAAMRKAHPDMGGDKEVSQIINKVMTNEDNRPGVKAARAERKAERTRERQQEAKAAAAEADQSQPGQEAAVEAKSNESAPVQEAAPQPATAEAPAQTGTTPESSNAQASPPPAETSRSSEQN